MEYRQLGGSGFKVPALSLGTGTFGGGGEFFKAWGASDVAEATRLVDICLEAGLTMFDSADVYSSGHGRGDPRPGDQGPPRPGASSRPRATFRIGAGPERRRLVAAPPDPAGRGQPAPARHRLHRPLPAARLRRPDAGRGGARHARRPGARRQDPLHRLLELLRLAPDEVAGRLGEVRPGPLRRPPGLLLADRPRLRMGADAAGARPEGRRGRLEPARLGPAHRQDPPRPAAAGDQPPAEQARRPTSARRSPTSTSTRSSTPSTRSPRRPARRCRRSRSTGCCSGRPWPTSSSARATRSSCARTSAPSAGT